MRTVLDVLLQLLLTFYQKFSRRHIARLFKKNVPFEWTNECQNAFQYLKKKLMEPTLFQYPDFSKEFCIITDASKQSCELKTDSTDS